MKKLFFLLLTILSVQILFGQRSSSAAGPNPDLGYKKTYLMENRQDMLSPKFQFPQSDFKIIGFGAYHGSARTYEAEKILLADLIERDLIDYYIPETNFCQAYFFQEYLKSGDDALLFELVSAFQSIVAQEGTIETFEFWRSFKKMNDRRPDEHKIQILGCDIINEYLFPIKYLLLLTENIPEWKERELLENYLTGDRADFSIRNKELENRLRSLISSYHENMSLYSGQIKDIPAFEHIIKNIQYNFNGDRDREKIILDNYIELHHRYGLENKKQFFKYGIFHIQKSREDNYPSFFTLLIENNLYDKNEIITITGYLTKSEVFWHKTYDKNGNYTGYTIEKGYGIGDYWKEYFKGIRKLKKLNLSDLTLYRLNKENSPYHHGSDLIQIQMLLQKSNKKYLKGKSTTDFIDYAVLIRNSRSQVPIEELDTR